MFRPAFLAVALVTAGCATAGLALAATSPASDDHRAQTTATPTGTLQMVLRPQSFSFVDNPPKRSGDGPPSPGDASITGYRVFDATGAKRLGRAQFVCVATDRRSQHEQCTGTIALPDGQIATQGDADNVAIVGGTGAYAGARGTATGQDHPHSVNVTIHFLP
jgi:soluble lytic murein transglycosylase-like protein